MHPYRTHELPTDTVTRVRSHTLVLLAVFFGVGACHQLYAEDVTALQQEVRLSSLAATHQADGGIGQILDLSNACAARAVQARHKLPLTSTAPWEAGCPQ